MIVYLSKDKVQYYNENILPDYIPSSYPEIRSRNERLEFESVISSKMKPLLLINTSKLVKKPEIKNIVNCKWILSLTFFYNPFTRGSSKARIVIVLCTWLKESCLYKVPSLISS